MPRRLLLAAPALAGALIVPVTLAAEEPPPTPASVTTAQRDEALAKAARYLDEEMWKLQEMGSPRRQYTVAVAGWSYLLAEAGEGARIPSRRKALERIRDYLARYVEQVATQYERADKKDKKKRKKKKKNPPPSGPPGFPGGFNRGPAQYVWTVSMAGHFFAESHALGEDKRGSKAALKEVVRTLEAAQQESGGWGHDDAQRPGMGLPPIKIPKPWGEGTFTYPGTLLAATNCAASALGVAHRALGGRRPKSLDNALDYYRAAQNGDGSFPYDPAQQHGTGGGAGPLSVTETARTGGALYAIGCAGGGDTELAQRAGESLDAHLKDLSEGHGSASMALQLGALACRARGDESWARFREAFFPRILAAQQSDGGFLCICKEGPGTTCDTKSLGAGMPEQWVREGQVYTTAIYALVLALDRRKPQAPPDLPGPQGPVTPR